MRTLKILIVLVILSIGHSETAFSQIRLGFKGGIDVADHKLKSLILDSENRVGFQIGPVVEIPIGLVRLNIGAQYGYKEYKITSHDRGADISEYKYISIPINLTKRIGIIPKLAGVFFTGGAYGNIKLSGGDLCFTDASHTWEELKARNFGMGVSAGLGVQLFEKMDVGLYYRCNLTDNYSSDKGNISNFKDKKYQAWSVGGIYFF